MRLAEIKIENFRSFGEGDAGLQLSLPVGIAALVGENDSGKTAIVDAIRLVLGIAIFNLTTLRAQKCDRSQLVVTQEDAQGMLQEIKKSGNKLGAALGNLRKQLAQ